MIEQDKLSVLLHLLYIFEDILNKPDSIFKYHILLISYSSHGLPKSSSIATESIKKVDCKKLDSIKIDSKI